MPLLPTRGAQYAWVVCVVPARLEAMYLRPRGRDRARCERPDATRRSLRTRNSRGRSLACVHNPNERAAAPAQTLPQSACAAAPANGCMQHRFARRARDEARPRNAASKLNNAYARLVAAHGLAHCSPSLRARASPRSRSSRRPRSSPGRARRCGAATRLVEGPDVSRGWVAHY